MNFAELETIWNAPANHPSAVQQQKLTKQLLTWLRRQRRHQLLWLVWTFGVLAVITGFAGWLIFGTDKVHLRMEWGLIPLLLLPWAFAFAFLKRFLKPAASGCRGDVPIADALARAVEANEAAQSRLRAIGVLYVIFVPVLAIAMWQLHAAGKASSRELLSMSIFFSGVLLLSGAGIFARYRFRLRPHHEHLKALLQNYGLNDLSSL
jgi:hypothetical protein